MNEYKPWIHTNVTNILKKTIKKDTKILEFGSGFSTLFFQNYSNNVISIEHNRSWYNKILPKINNNTKYILKEEDYISKPSYDSIFYSCNSLNELLNIEIPDEYFDIILVDGINRVNCVLASYKKLKRKGILILDDSNRIDNPAGDGSYKPIQELLKDWTQIKNRSNDRNTDYWIKP